MPWTMAEKNAAADWRAARCGWVAAFTGDPSSTGANEATGTGYARVAVTWSVASSGIARPASDISIPIPGGQTITGVGFFSASTGGTFRGYVPLPTPREFPAGSTRYLSVLAANIGITESLSPTAG